MNSSIKDAYVHIIGGDSLHFECGFREVYHVHKGCFRSSYLGELYRVVRVPNTEKNFNLYIDRDEIRSKIDG
jgi:hypothetical protein